MTKQQWFVEYGKVIKQDFTYENMASLVCFFKHNGATQLI